MVFAVTAPPSGVVAMSAKLNVGRANNTTRTRILILLGIKPPLIGKTGGR
jgi:hypothetical protein